MSRQTGQDFRQAVAAIVSNPIPADIGNWERGLIASENGSPKALSGNAIYALRNSPEWAGVIARDSFAMRTLAREETPWGFSGPWTETQDALLAEWLQRKRIYVSSDVAARAVETVAEEQSFHPVHEYLDSLKWDQVPRLDKWLVTYAGAEDTPYVRAVGSAWMKSAIARVRRPGCKADHVPIIEGPQGSRKSTLVKTVGGEFFSDEIADLGSKDASMQVAGKWIIELAELDAFARSEQSKLKAFISRSTDRFRPPYGRRIIEAPRQSVFIGTVNSSSYLKDETGGRRYWPVRSNAIDIAALQRDRDQLWAEAQLRFSAGEHWWIEDAGVIEEAAAEQADRFECDPWAEAIETWSDTLESVTVDQVLTQCLNKPKGQWQQADQNRVARCLRTLGWHRYQQRVGKAREWRYRRIEE